MTSIAETQLARIDAFTSKVGLGLAAIGAGAAIGLSFDKLKESISGAIEAAAGLEKLAVRTGATVDGLSALSNVARLSNTSTDELAKGLQKLDKALVDAEQGGTKSTAAFAALGLAAKDFQGLSSDQAFVKVAQALGQYQDGIEKTALAQQLFGKAGANLLPTMKDIAEVGVSQVKVTTDQARAAEDYERTLRKLQIATEDVFRAIGLELVPVLNAFAKTLLQAETGTEGLNAGIKGLAADHSIRDWAEDAARVVAKVVDAFDGVWRVVEIVGRGIAALLAATGAAYYHQFDQAKQILKDFASDADAILNAPQFSAKLEAQLAAARKPAEEAVKPKLKPIDASGPDTDKAVLDQQLKTLDAFIGSEKQLLTQRQTILQKYYADDKLSIADYFGGKIRAEQDAAQSISAAYDKEIADVQHYIKVQDDEKVTIEGNTKIKELQQKQQDAVNAAASKAIELAEEQAKATEQYSATVAKLNEQLLAQEGRLGAVARLQVEQADKSIRARAALEGDSTTLATVAALEKQKIAQGEINEQLQQSALIQEKLSTAEGRINLEVATGQKNELQGLQASDNLRRAQIDQLQKIADEYQRIADTETGAVGAKAQADADAYRLKIDQLAASSDQFGKKFTDIFQTQFEGAFASFIDGTKSMSKAFDDFAKSIATNLTQIASKNIAQSLLGGGPSGSGGIGSLFASLFGSSSGSGLAAGQAGPPSNLAGAGLLASAGSWFGGLFAGGGQTNASQAYLVGESGPELFVPGQSGTVNPSGSYGGHTINVNLPAGYQGTRDSINQIGATVARHLAIASARG